MVRTRSAASATGDQDRSRDDEGDNFEIFHLDFQSYDTMFTCTEHAYITQ